MFKYWKIAVVGLALAGLIAGFVRAYGPANPVQEGQPDEFLYALTKVRLVEGRQHDSHVEALYEVKDGHCLYYRSAPREQNVYVTTADAVQPLLPAMVARIEAEPAEHVADWVKPGVQLWSEADPPRQDVATFVRCEGARRLQWMDKHQVGQLSLSRLREDAVNDRWNRAWWYPRVALGELLYLCGLVVFAAWPFIRKTGPVSWAVHLGLLPILLFLPYWLGYASRTFSGLRLKGGVVYPLMLARFDFLPWYGIDTTATAVLPPVLESVAPIDTTVKMQHALHGGPSLVFASGLAIGLTTYGLRNMRSLRLRAIRRRRRRERAEEKERRAERMREWEVQRAELLAEVLGLLKGEILPAFERRLRAEFALADNEADKDATTDEEFFVEGSDHSRSPGRLSEDGTVSPTLHVANDIPFPFECPPPGASNQSMVARSANNSPAEATASSEPASRNNTTGQTLEQPANAPPAAGSATTGSP